MELYAELLLHILQTRSTELSFYSSEANVNQLIEMECYNALQKIKAVIHDDSLNDEECFQRIEQIVCILESVGSNGGTRHDFG